VVIKPATDMYVYLLISRTVSMQWSIRCFLTIQGAVEWMDEAGRPLVGEYTCMGCGTVYKQSIIVRL
jgi:hypothetical protein